MPVPLLLLIIVLTRNLNFELLCYTYIEKYLYEILFCICVNYLLSSTHRIPRTHTGCSLNIVFFPRILESLLPLPLQHSAAIACTKNYQPIGVIVHSHCVESLHRYVGEGWIAVDIGKTQFFLNTLYCRTYCRRGDKM